MHLINHSLKKGAAIAAAGALMFSLFVSGGTVMAAPPDVPVITSPANGSSTTTLTATITGTAEAGMEVRVSGGTSPADGIADASGHWVAFVGLSPDTANFLEFSTRNMATGEVGSSTSLTIIQTSAAADVTPPAAPIVVSPTSPVSTTTSTIVVAGTAEDNSVISITGGAVAVNATASAGGTWSALVDLTPLSTNTLHITSTDAAGNVSGITTLVVHAVATSTPDVTTPATPVITYPTNGTSTSTNPLRIYGTGEEGTEVFVGGGTSPASGIVNASGNWTALVGLTPNASNVLTFFARDAAGNNSTSTTLTIIHSTGTSTSDVTAPVAPVITFPTNPYTTTSSAVVLTGTAEGGSAINISGVNGSSVATTTTSAGGNFSVFLPLVSGTTSTYFVTATDAAGNTSSSTSIMITQTTSTSTATTTTGTSSPVITLTGDNNMTIFACNGFTDPGASAVSSTGVGLTVTATSSVDLNNPGSYNVTYTAVDASGNTSTLTRTVLVRACSSGGGGGSSSSNNSGGNSSNNGSSSGNGTIPPFIGVGSGSGVLPIVVTGIPTTQVLGASFVPGLPSTGGSGETNKVLISLLLSGALALLGFSIARRKSKLS